MSKVKTAEALEVVSAWLDKGVKALPRVEIPKVEIPAGEGDPEEVVLLLSDLQIGLTTPSTNAEIIQARLEKLGKRLIKIVGLHRRAYRLDKLHIFALGDLVHNERIGRTVDLDELEMVLMKQCFEVAVPALERFLATLLPHFPAGIEVWTVSGNHGRLDRLHASSTNFDTIIYRFLAERFRDFEELDFHIEAERFYQKVTLGEGKVTFLLVHGDTIKMWMNIPWYGITQRAMRWDGAIPGESFQYLVLGHFHVPADFVWNDKRIIANGCFVSDDQWVLKGIGMAVSASQVVFGVHPVQGVTWKYLVKLG